MFEKIRHKSFRHQCKLSAAKGKWIFCKEDRTKITELTDELAKLMDELEWRINSRRRYNREVLL